MAIPDQDHAQVYNAFYKELGVNNITEALKITYGGKDFARRFKNSEAYKQYLLEKSEEERRLKEPNGNFLSSEYERRILCLGLNKKKLANQLGISHQALTFYIKGVHRTPYEVEINLINALKMNNN